MKLLKKMVFCFLLAGLCVSLLAGCRAGKGEKVKAFSVGYAKALITPEESVPLRGYGDALERFSEGQLEDMYATCVAFADTEGNKLLLISTDLTNSPNSLSATSRKQISEATGIPFSNILFTASHSHSAPDYSQSVPSITNYMTLFLERVLAAAKESVADLAPATMETGYNRVDRTNSVRHYLLADGSYRGDKMGSVPDADVIGHATKVDNLLQVVRFTREGDKKPVVLVNWCGHPKKADGDLYKLVGPNYVGVLRQALEEQYDCYVSYVLSGSGNVNNNSSVAGEVDHKDYVGLGNRLAKEVSDILDNRLAASKLDKIYLNENIWVAKNKNGKEIELPLYAFSIGEWACVTAPFEIFDTNSMAVRDASPFKMTFYAACANASNGYLPTPESYDWEIKYEARVTKFPAGTAENLQNELIRQLGEIFTAAGYEPMEKGDGYNTPEYAPHTDGKVYLNLKVGEEATAVKNGFYALVLSDGSTFKNMLCIDEETAKAVMAKEEMKLLFNDSNVIVGFAE